MIKALKKSMYTPGQLNYTSGFGKSEIWSHYQNPFFWEYLDGRVRMSWWAYNRQECDNNAVVLYSISNDRGNSWSTPNVWFASINASASHFKTVRLDDTGKQIMAYREVVHEDLYTDDSGKTHWADYSKNKDCRIVLCNANSDIGLWRKYREVAPGLVDPEYDGEFCYMGPEALVRLDSGRLLLACVYLPKKHSNPQHFYCSLVISDDKGDTWNRSVTLTVDENRGIMEPHFIESNGEIVCFIRNRSGYIYEMRSYDNAENWTTPCKTNLPSPESISRSIKLKSGAILLVWNNVHSPENQHPRHPLSAVLSDDMGLTWTTTKQIADETGTNQLSNHDLIQLKDGRILLGISHYYDETSPKYSELDIATFDEKWLRS